MAVNIGPKIGIDGEKEYRKEMQQIIQQGKTLSAQMGAVASSFQNADNKEEDLTKASKLLNDQVANQQKLVEKLADAVSMSAKETGENSTTTLKWKEQLAKAETELNKLEGTTAESAVGMGELAESEKDAGDAAKGASGKVTAFTVALGQLMADAIKEGIKFIADSVKKIGQYFVDATKGAAAYADEIITLSAVTSMSTDSLQEYKYMAALTDTELETITGSLTKLTKNMSSAADGSGSAADAFKKLGVSVTDSNGELRDTNSVFEEAITALGSIQNETERDALAMQIFGKSAKDLNPLIEAGGDALETFRQEAHDVGYVLDGETLDAMGRVQDGFDRLGLAAESAKNQIGAAIGQFILPYLNELVGAVQGLLGGGDLGEFVDRISGVLNGLLSALAEALPTVLQAGGEIAGNLLIGINSMLPELAPLAVSLIGDFARFILSNLPLILETAVSVVLELARGLAQEAPTLIPAAIQCILTIAQGLLSHIGDIISAALMLVDGIVEGLTSDEGINTIIDAIPILVMSLLDGILSNLDKIIAAGINLTVNLAVGLVKAIPKLIAMIPKIIMAIVNAFKSFDWSSLGGNIMGNLSDGVKNAATTIWNAVKDAFESAVNWIKNLGSQALNWGRDMIQGFVNGIKEKAQKVVDGVKNIAEKIKGFLHFSRPDFGPLRDYESWMPDFMEGLAQGIDANAWRVQDALANATGGMSVMGQGGSVTNMGGVSVNVYAQPGQDARAIAQEVIRVMTNQVNAKKAVFA